MPRKPQTSHSQTIIDRERALIVHHIGPEIKYGDLARVARLLNTSPARCAYWYRKDFDPDFHSTVRKGSDSKLATFQSWEEEDIQKAIYSYLETKPKTGLEGVRKMLEETFQRKVSKPVASRTLQKMGWSWKVPTAFQIAKYSKANLLRYVNFVDWIQSLPDWTKLKFVDESHIIPRKMGNTKVLSLVNKRAYTKDSTLHQASASISLITTLEGHNDMSVFLDYREESNTQYDFLEFILRACEEGVLGEGDFLICDNAAVHGGLATLDCLVEILDTVGATLVYLPAYSPELNPCELVFSMMKGQIRRCPHDNEQMLDRVLDALLDVTPKHLLSFYKHCIFPKVTLPDLDIP